MILSLLSWLLVTLSCNSKRLTAGPSVLGNPLLKPIQVDDEFWHKIRREFSAINKGNADDYLVTQFIAALAQNAGFDGLRFRSSLVQEGTNYVIFNGDSCTPISPKMYVIPRVKYDLMPVIPE